MLKARWDRRARDWNANTLARRKDVTASKGKSRHHRLANAPARAEVLGDISTGSVSKGTPCSRAASRRRARPKQTRTGNGIETSIGQSQPASGASPWLLGSRRDAKSAGSALIHCALR